MVGDLDVPPLWLRDACTCGECRDEFSGQRLRGVLALDPRTDIDTEPVCLHVAAKRYLVATEPDDAAKLSEASVHTLRLQGGAMPAGQIGAFESGDHAAAAVALRRLDEAAKDASWAAPGFDTYRDVLRIVLHREARRRSLA